MHKRILLVAALAAGFIYIMGGCNKLDTTDIGSNLIPPVDNVKTFDTLLEVTGAQAFMADSAKPSNQEDLPLGYISLANDPVFGKTTANIFAQFKPNFYPYYLGNPKDTIQGYSDIGIDSLVVCLAYKGYYGDSTTSQKFELKEILAPDFKDSAYGFYYRPTSGQMGPVLGSTVAAPQDMRRQVMLANGKDSVRNQLRIRITNPTFLARFASFDSTASGSNNAFNRDSLWRVFFKGFAISPDSTNGAYGRNLSYFNLNDATSRLEVHYRKRPGTYNAGKVDTSYSILPFAISASGTLTTASAFACNITRTYQGAEIASPAPGAVYIQTGPGTYDTIKVPSLTALPNCIVHRAELIMEQVPGISLVDQAMVPPNYMFLDIVDTANKNYYRPFPLDLNPDGGYSVFPGVNNINFAYFGGYLRYKNDVFGNRIGYYSINISRHVQGIITRKEPNKTLRLYAPYELDYTGQLGFFARYRYLNSLAYGRVKLGDGTNPNYKMRLRIIYSKI